VGCPRCKTHVIPQLNTVVSPSPFALVDDVITNCSLCYSIVCACLAVACLATSCSTVTYFIATIIDADTDTSIFTHFNDYTYIASLTVHAKTFMVV
jgi:hypothetical protein